MEPYTKKTRSEKYINKLERWLKKDDFHGFEHNDKGDVVLILDPKKIYVPHIDQNWNGGGHVSYYYLKKLDHLKYQPALVRGTSDEWINYYAPCHENDLWITPPSDEDMTLNDMKRKRPCIDAMELMGVKLFSKKEHLRDPMSYIWLPHPNILPRFQEFLERALSKKEMKSINDVLIEYYKRC